MGLFLSILQTLAIMSGVSLLVVVLVGAITSFWIKKAVKNKVYAIFLEQNRQIARELIPTTGTEKIKSADGGDYLIVPKKTMWSYWPPGVPIWLQEVVPTCFYMRNQAEPFDPSDNKSVITANSLRYITDEGMLKQTWKEAAEAAGVGKILGKDLTPWFAGASLLAILGLTYFVFSLLGDVGDLVRMIRDLKAYVEGL